MSRIVGGESCPRSSRIRRFLRCENGFVNTVELVFLGAILVIGVLPGVATLRDAIVTELADMAEAVNPGGPTGDPVDPVDGPDGGVTTAADVFGP